MISKLKINLVIAILVCFITNINAQNKEQLQQRKLKLEKEIEFTNKILSETTKDKILSIDKIKVLNSRISKRESLIIAIQSETNEISEDIKKTNDTIERLENSLNKLIDEYVKLLNHTSKNRNSYTRLMFILSAENFNQAYQRIKYFQQYSAYRKGQARVIKETQTKLTKKIELLKIKKLEKVNLQKNEEYERLKLTKEKNEQNDQVKELSKKERELKKKIKQNTAAAEKLNKEIERLIAEEIRKAELAAKKSSEKAGTAYKKPEANVGSSTTFALSPEEKIISNSFAENRGKLPWPVEKGVITSTFGEHPHPVLKNIKIKNNGIDILTENNQKARAIFDGSVTTVMSMPNYGTVVIIRHGDFLTVYSNLANANVKKGDKIKIKQIIGTIKKNDENNTVIHFELWKNKTLQDPMQWIAR